MNTDAGFDGVIKHINYFTTRQNLHNNKWAKYFEKKQHSFIASNLDVHFLPNIYYWYLIVHIKMFIWSNNILWLNRSIGMPTSPILSFILSLICFSSFSPSPQLIPSLFPFPTFITIITQLSTNSPLIGFVSLPLSTRQNPMNSITLFIPFIFTFIQSIFNLVQILSNSTDLLWTKISSLSPSKSNQLFRFICSLLIDTIF